MEVLDNQKNESLVQGRQEIKKVVFLSHVHFNERGYHRFGIQTLQENGFEVEVWLVQQAFYPQVAKAYTPPDPTYPFVGLRQFSEKDEVFKELRSLDTDVFIFSLMHYSMERWHIFKAMTDSKAQYGVFHIDIFPRERPKNVFDKYFQKFKRSIHFGLKDLPKLIFAKIPKRFVGIKEPRFLVVGALKAKSNGVTEVLNVHAWDYDKYLELKDRPKPEKPIAVFLDQYIPFHPERIYFGRKPLIEAPEYYPYLVKAFERVEEELGYEVVIAGHPRSDYPKQGDLFKGRRIIRGKSAELVKDCDLVIGHDSNSTIFANIFNKPMLFITTRILDEGYHGTYIRALAESFGKEQVFVDREFVFDWSKELKVDQKKYDQYREDIVKKKGTAELPFWQIVSERLKQGI